ncbi:NB-ARC domain-containing protein [Streptomyces decoyicus]|uniref:NB-ARC domain-containing protein n=1 Tax=Streptomyces decoyicus TaxID=249567 RepID=UPI0034075B40
MTIIARHGGVAVGSAGSVVIHESPPMREDWPRQIGLVPGQADCFQHREAASRLDWAVAEGGTAVMCQLLSGTGGVGKTQLAAHYARTTWDAGQVDLLMWVTAGSREAITTAYAQAGAQVAGADLEDPEDAAARLLSWLQTTDRKWLIVLDDLADPADLRGLWPPTQRRGKALVTTRRRDAALSGPGRRRIDIGLFSPAESIAYLTAKLAAAHRNDDAAQIAGLADDLGHLPLALAQAVTYLIDLGLSCAGYRTRLADRTRELADVMPEKGNLPDDHRDIIAATWSLSVEHADALRPQGLARRMLELASVLDPNGIPVVILTAPPALRSLGIRRKAMIRGRRERKKAPESVSVQEAADSLRCLHRLSLVDFVPDARHETVRVHHLVQRATREAHALGYVQDGSRMDESDWRNLTIGSDACWAAESVEHVRRERDREFTLLPVLRANAEAVANHMATGGSSDRFSLGLRVGAAGQAAVAREQFEDLLAGLSAEEEPKPALFQSPGNRRAYELGKHIEQLSARHNVAWWQMEAGDSAGAVVAFEKLLLDKEEVFGRNHLSTFGTRYGLAWAQGESGDAATAVKAFVALLADRIQALTYKTRTFSPRRSVRAAQRIRDEKMAVDLEARSGATDRSPGALPQLEPPVPSARYGLAWWRGRAGDPSGAVAGFEALLADQVRLLDTFDPQRLATRHALAHWRGEAGEPGRAVILLTDLLADQTGNLGPEHPDTLKTRHSLAQWRGEAGEPDRAVVLLTELLADRTSILGPLHPHTRATRDALADWLSRSGSS